MKVKKYTAPSMTEAMKLIRGELGSDAVIISSRPVFSGGFLGLFKKRSIEVIAAIDPIPSSNQVSIKEKERKKAVQQTESSLPPSIEEKPIEIVTPKQDNADLLKEIAELKGMLENIRVQPKTDSHYPDILQTIHLNLVNQEINDAIRGKVMDSLLEKWKSSKHEVTLDEANSWLELELLDSLNWISEEKKAFEKKYINIVGPTGVGKTTTLAKLASEAMLNNDKKVAFITTDTYRIAAIDQLKTYAKILNVPIEVAYNLEDFKLAKERFSHYDLVFIDTAGRNFRNAQYVKDLEKIIDFSNEMETYLVLSLTSKQRDMEEIYHQFSAIPLKQVIFTKADETSTYGAMVNFISHYRLAPAYITNGQNVPDDIEEATPEVITKAVCEAQNV